MPSESSASNANAPGLQPLGSHARSPALPLTRLLTLIGSDPRCHLNLVSSTVSRQHAIIVSSGGRAYVRDLVSRTKVLVNQQPVLEAELKAGDELQIGKFSFAFTPSPSPTAPTASPAPAALTISDRPESLPLKGLTVLVGRDKECDVAIDHPEVSARHAIIFSVDGKRYVRDLNSRTGTFLNGSRIRQQEVLFGDQIRVGETRLELTAAARPKAAAPAPAPTPQPSRPVAPSIPAPRPVPARIVLPRPAAPKPPAAPLPLEPEPLEVSKVESPVVSKVEPPAVIEPEPPVVEELEPPLVNEIAPPAVSEVEPTAEIEAEPPKVAKSEPELPLAPLELAEPTTPANALEPPEPQPEPELAPTPPAEDADLPLAPLDEIEPPPAVVSETPAEEEVHATPHESLGPIDIEEAPPVAEIETPAPSSPEELAQDRELEAPAESHFEPAPLEEPDASRPAIADEIESPEPEAPAPAAEPRISGLDLDVDDFPEVAPVAESPADELDLPPAQEEQPMPAEAESPEPEVLETPGASVGATLDLDTVLPQMPAGVSAAPLSSPSDTEFGKQVEQFSGESTGPLVEESPVAGEFEPPASDDIESPAAVGFETTLVSDIEPPVVSEFEPPVMSEIEPPVVSEIEPLAVSEIEPPVMGELEPLVVSDVEPLAASDIEPPAVSDTEPPNSPLETPPAPPAPTRPAGKSRSSFSLDDGFFNADLAANGIFVRQKNSSIATSISGPPRVQISPLGSNPAQSGAAPRQPPAAPGAKHDAGAPDASGLDWTSPSPTLDADNFLGGLPVNLMPPKAPPPNRPQVAVSFDQRRPQPGKPGAPKKQPGGVDIPTPPPKARRQRATPFATKSMGIAPDDDQAPTPPRPNRGNARGKTAAPGPTTAFDGLAMPARDVFSDFEATALNDAAFGGTRLSRGDDYILPESPENAERIANNPDEDFADSEFWDRTDEDDGLPPMGAPKPGSTAQAPPATETEPPAAEETEAPAEIAEQIPEEIQNPLSVPAAESELDTLSLDDAPAAPPEIEDNPVGPPPPSVLKDESEETWADVPVATPAPVDAAVDEPAPVEEIPPETPATPPAKPKRRPSRTRILPILMLCMLLCMGIVLAGIWVVIQPKSHVVGTLTYLNINWVPGTDDGSGFEAGQRRIIESPDTHNHARDVLSQRDPDTSPGFLGDDAAKYLSVASTVKLSSAQVNGQPQTTLQLTADGSDKTRDTQRMTAMLQAVIDANASTLDDNRRVRQIADAARQEVDDANQRISEIKTQMPSLQRAVDQDPDPTEFAALTQKKDDLQKARFASEDQLDQDRLDLERLQSGATQAAADPPIVPAAPDPQLEQLRRQIVALNQELQDAKSQQSAGVASARQALEAAENQFNDQIAASDKVLDSSSQLRQFVDSAKDSQDKAREMITTLIVDGEDLQRQLEDTRRDVEEMIQTRQQEIWAGDPQLQQLQQQLDDAQHRYNAAVGEGVQDQQLLGSLHTEIDNLTGQVKTRKATLGLDPSEVKVADGLNKVIDSLRRKLQKEKDQIDDVLSPLEKQLSDLDPQVAALPEAQQDLARQLRQSLGALSDARKNYADALGEGDTAPSAKVTDLQKQLDDIKARFDRRQADLTQQRPQQAATDLLNAQKRFEVDKQSLEDVKKQYETVRVQYDDEAGRREDAQNAQAQLGELTEELNNRQSQLEVAARDRDQKQLQADRCFDIKPLTDADILGTAIDPRPLFSLYAMGGLAVLFTLITIYASRRAAERRPGRTSPADAPSHQEDADDDRHMMPA